MPGHGIALLGSGPWQEPRPGEVSVDVTIALAGSRAGGPLRQVHCIGRDHTAHATAASGRTLLLSLFREKDGQAAIVELTLP